MQVGIDFGNESDGYRLTVGCRQVLILVVRVTVEGNLGDAGSL